MNTNRKVGTLVLVKVNKQSEELKLDTLVNLTNGQIGIIYAPPTEHFSKFGITTNSGRKSVDKLHITRIWKPIIICDDEIEVGELIYDSFVNLITTYDGTIDPYHLRKILVHPEQFSQEFLQTIVDGKVKYGDKVEVEIIDQDFIVDGLEHYCNICKQSELNCSCDEQIVKLRTDGTAIIHPYTESVEEAAIRYIKGLYPNYMYPEALADLFKAGAEWQKNQKK